MFEKNQLIGSYSIKRVLPPEGAIQKYLSEDPFFNTSVTLNILDVRPLSQEQKHLLFSFLQKIFTLEHDALLAVYDSGFESDYVFFTNPREHKCSLLQRMEQGLSTEESLNILRNIVSALDRAAENNLTHGSLTAQQIYFSQSDVPFIENFGVQHYYFSVINNENTEYPLKNVFSDIDNLFLKLRISVTDKNVIKPYINNELDNLSKKLKDTYKYKINSIHQIIKEIDNIISNFNIDDNHVENLSEDRFDINKREDVLPFIRGVIEEKNKLKFEIIELRKINKSYEQKLLECENKSKYIENNKNLTISYDSENNRKYYITILVSFIFGIFITTIFMKSFNFHEIEKLDNARSDAKIVKIQDPIFENSALAAEKDINKNTNEKVENIPAGVSASKVNAESFQAPEPLSQVPAPGLEKEDKQEKRLFVETRNWWPKGEEFRDPVPLKEQKITSHNGLTDIEAEAVFNQLINWAGAWEKQDIDTYLACYSDKFIPPGHRGLEAWKKLRRSRIAKPDWIKVFIQNISMSKLSASDVTVEFQQDYLSDTFEDQSIKVVTLSKNGNAWLITSEKSLQ